MAFRVEWTESAWQELERAAAFIARDSIRYAAALVANTREAARSLRVFPLRGRIVPEVGDDSVRELFTQGYRLIYEIQSERIVVIAFLHGARRFPVDLR